MSPALIPAMSDDPDFVSLGLTVVDQTISYLLLHCTKVVAVPGVAGKVLQVRSFLQNALEYKSITTGGTADDLVSFLVSRLSGKNYN